MRPSATATHHRPPARPGPSTPPPSADPVFVGVGDIADCAPHTRTTATRQPSSRASTATSWTTGDNVYPTGTAAEFTNCYDPSWGVPSIKSRTRPVPGNHDWRHGGPETSTATTATSARTRPTPTARATTATTSRRSNWHIVNLDSECAARARAAAPPARRRSSGSRPTWPPTARKNVIALWHKPRFSSGVTHVPDRAAAACATTCMRPASTSCSTATTTSTSDSLRWIRLLRPTRSTGIRQFTVGTGGASEQTSFNLPLDQRGAQRQRVRGFEADAACQFVRLEVPADRGQTFTDTAPLRCTAPRPVARRIRTFRSQPAPARSRSPKCGKHGGSWWAVMPSTTVTRRAPGYGGSSPTTRGRTCYGSPAARPPRRT